MKMEVRWIEWVRRPQAIEQNGLMFSKAPFDRERYEQVRSIAAEILASSTQMDPVLVHNLLQGEQGYATPKIDVRRTRLRLSGCKPGKGEHAAFLKKYRDLGSPSSESPHTP